MAKKRKNKDHPSHHQHHQVGTPSGSPMTQSSKSNSPNWFTEHLSRRKLGKGLMWTAALGMAGLTVYKISDKDDPEVTLDSLELQRKEGWNVGSTEKTLVPVFDNWPHPLGVVRSHETLGALVYYAHEIEEKRSKVPENAPALILLDGNRLATYTDQDTQFDNRYLAKLPPADQLKQRGIQQVIYLTKDQTQTAELDDINDNIVESHKKGINGSLLR